MAHRPLEGPIRPQNPIAMLAAALRKFKPLVNESGKWEGGFEDRDPLDPAPTRDELVNTAGQAVSAMHGFITEMEILKAAATDAAKTVRDLREDYTQLGDILNHFIHINPNDIDAVKRTQESTRAYLQSLKQGARVELANEPPPSSNGHHPDLKVLPPPEDTQGGDSTLGASGQ